MINLLSDKEKPIASLMYHKDIFNNNSTFINSFFTTSKNYQFKWSDNFVITCKGRKMSQIPCCVYALSMFVSLFLIVADDGKKIHTIFKFLISFYTQYLIDT
jgi:hypothetical protein